MSKRQKIFGGPFLIELVEASASQPALQVVKTPDGDFVVLGPALAPFGKLAKEEVDRLDWADVRDVSVDVRRDGSASHPRARKTQVVVAVRQEQFPMVLARLDLRGMNDVVRDALVAYIQECAAALFAYFTTGAAVNPRADFGRATAEELFARVADLERLILLGNGLVTSAQAHELTRTKRRTAEWLVEQGVSRNLRAAHFKIQSELRAIFGWWGPGQSTERLPAERYGHVLAWYAARENEYRAFRARRCDGIQQSLFANPSQRRSEASN